MGILAEGRLKAIVRADLGPEVYRRIRDLIVMGDLAQGERLVEAEIADLLAVSRTPVREALQRLRREEFAVQRGSKGLEVSQIRAHDVSQLYPLIGAIECFLVSQFVEFGPDQVAKLEEIDRRADAAVDDFEERVSLGNQWHKVLVAQSDNERAKNLLKGLQAHLFRLEYYFFATMEPGGISGNSEPERFSATSHDEVISALQNADFTLAGQRILDHWTECAERLIGLLDEMQCT